MKNKVYFSKELNQHYRYTKDGIIFEDKVTYTNEEINIIKNSDVDIKIIHEAKLKFDGHLISDEDLEKLTEKYKNEPSNFNLAVNHASGLIKQGMKGLEAIYKASNKYNIAISAIGKELGRRNKK